MTENVSVTEKVLVEVDDGLMIGVRLPWSDYAASGMAPSA